jgi:hypothetical protein
VPLWVTTVPNPSSEETALEQIKIVLLKMEKYNQEAKNTMVTKKKRRKRI